MILYSKLNKQIKPTKTEAKGRGYIFLATDEQKANGLYSVSAKTRKQLMAHMRYLAIYDDDYREEFTR